MRYGVLLVLAFAILLLSIQACAQCGFNWLGGASVGSETSTPVGFERPNMDMPKPNPLPLTTQAAENPVTSNPANNTTNSTNITSNNDSVMAEETPAPKAVATVDGNWYFELVDSKTRYLDLTLFSVANMVTGRGSLNQDNKTLTVTTRGSQAETKVKLDIISFDEKTYTEDILFKLDLQMDNQTLSGSYDAYDAQGSKVIGQATGKML